MKFKTDLILQQAINAHQAGKLNEAKQLYLTILKTEPRHPNANHNLGILKMSINESTEALKLFKVTTEVNPDKAQFWMSYGNAHTQENQLEEAEIKYKTAIRLNPDLAEAHNNLGLVMMRSNRMKEAETYYKNAIKINENYGDGYYNLGKLLDKLERFEEAEIIFKKAIKIKPDLIQSHEGFGNLLYRLKRFDEAKSCYEKVIEFDSNNVEAYNKLGNTLHSLNKLNEAELSYKKALELNPDYAAIYINLANIQHDKGDLLSAIKNFNKALYIKPEFYEAWAGIFFSLQAIKLQNPSIENYLPSLDKLLSNKYARVARSLLIYRLNLGKPSINKYFNQALSNFSLVENIFIKNPKTSSIKLIEKPITPKKITALVHFGRSGTGLLHSLIDGHSEVSTLPSIYLSEFFDYFNWKNIIDGGWEEMADRFTKIYAVLFDASSTKKVPAKNSNYIRIGHEEGMTNVGTKKNEVLSINKKIFIKELNQLINCHNSLDAVSFFKLIHLAYEKVLHNHNKKNLIFYHIHNPDMYAQLNFSKLTDSTRWLMMVREPLQSCESWIKSDFLNSRYRNISNKIYQMLFDIDQPIFNNDNSIGIRLEDLKEYPRETIFALCKWLGIKEKDTLYQMTAQGKKWWGDPTSPDYMKDGMNPFGKNSINRKLGSVFNKNDQFIMRTLFYPFSVRFGYIKENLKQFKKDLLIIRPMLDQMFDFERKITQDTKTSTEDFMKSGTYLYLRSGMIERWNTLNEFGTYPNMITPLQIN